MKLTERLMHKYALSKKGAKNLEVAFCINTITNILLFLPVGFLFMVVRDLMQEGKISSLAFYAIGSLLALTFIFIAEYFQYNANFLSTYEESGIRRSHLAEKLRKIPLSFFGKKDLSDLTNTIMADSARLETLTSHWIPALIGSIISTTVVAVSLFLFDYRMALAALWVLPVSFGIVLCSAKVQNHFSRKQNKLKLACADGIQECLETIRDLKANNAEKEYLKGLDAKIKAVEKHAIIAELVTAVFVSSAQMILKFGIVTVAIVGSSLLVSGQLDVLTFFMFLLVVSRLYDPLQMSLQNLAAVISTNIASERMDVILSHKVQSGSEQLTNKGYDIVFNHVGFAYDTSETVLKDVSFVAKQGEVTALIGPSGGGKTTISRLASRFWDISKGTITVGGMDISKTDSEKLMQLYSIVFQEVSLFNNTVMENIRLGRQGATDEEVKWAAKMANCDEFVSKMEHGYNTMIGENGCELSGGERQRISIARAFLKDAPIIFLDEATASLDVDNENIVQESLSRLIHNKTVMIIAHRMRTVANVDHIVVLRDGVVAQDGKPEELLKQEGVYKHMVDLQIKSENWKMA
ncbi:ABC transporter ATP-binding/transmembrane protein [Lachnospiraceae bacterium KM106-2]|nr:ABC transporter ATP-binding/transmembrane protein [Lachnospiraceae bacterium KM106-2]